jgi:hypothetical protein
MPEPGPSGLCDRHDYSPADHLPFL